MYLGQKSQSKITSYCVNKLKNINSILKCYIEIQFGTYLSPIVYKRQLICEKMREIP